MHIPSIIPNPKHFLLGQGQFKKYDLCKQAVRFLFTFSEKMVNGDVLDISHHCKNFFEEGLLSDVNFRCNSPAKEV